ncbi:uncharacterized protein EV422DRAFT_570072 [Fimicolochytrium jonesii]|uniref:uncharacterized protein n=1 Tax=Fimicolochytrium jonesii TaxID=1396493 RepID=UPI0022FE4646|nr:uncharacterized protein EV422DRAFT_570072 [Fimicolochytrium jonesii]KAI8817918.1 hypothetical protein EV422DRAFT_570072 [Fimicolochytrium jonesii]
MDTYPDLPEGVEGVDLLRRMAEASADDYRTKDVARRAAFADGGALAALLESRNRNAPWNSGIPCSEACRRVERCPELMSLLRRVVSTNGCLGRPTTVEEEVLAVFPRDDEADDAEDSGTKYRMYVRALTLSNGDGLAQSLERFEMLRPIDTGFGHLLRTLGWAGSGVGPLTLLYVGCSMASSPEGRKVDDDELRVSVLAREAKAAGALVSYHTYTVMSVETPAADEDEDDEDDEKEAQSTGRSWAGPTVWQRVDPDVAEVEAVVRLVLGPCALNCAVGGFRHVVNLAPATRECISKVTDRLTQVLTAEHSPTDEHKRHERKIKAEVRAAYRSSMPKVLSEAMCERVRLLAMKQSTMVAS